LNKDNHRILKKIIKSRREKMRISGKNSFLTMIVLAIFLTLLTSIGITADVNKMTKEQLKNIMDDDTVSILDARKGRDWSSSEFKIKGADRVDPKKFDISSAIYPKDNTLVLYCA